MIVALAIFLGVCVCVLIGIGVYRLVGWTRRAARNRRRRQARLELGRSLGNRRFRWRE